jgi:antitoxin HicB
MRFAYPYVLTRDRDGVDIDFPDVPECTAWFPLGLSEEQECKEISDALASGLYFYARAREPFPKPSRPKRGQKLAVPDALSCAKFALADAMREERVSNVALAKRMGVDERAVRRLLDVSQRSHIGEIERALALLGRRLEVDAHAA